MAVTNKNLMKKFEKISGIKPQFRHNRSICVCDFMKNGVRIGGWCVYEGCLNKTKGGQQKATRFFVRTEMHNWYLEHIGLKTWKG